KTNLQRFALEKFPQADFPTNALPFTDLCVRRDGVWLCAVPTDDERYMSSLSVKDIHAYTPAPLSRKHWDSRRTHSRNYWLGRGRVENDLLRIMGIQDSP